MIRKVNMPQEGFSVRIYVRVFLCSFILLLKKKEKEIKPSKCKDLIVIIKP